VPTLDVTDDELRMRAEGRAGAAAMKQRASYAPATLGSVARAEIIRIIV
jgi:hypothetical protein